jgi:hypothetical protein
MAVNRRRGEVEATFDGRPYRLVLTLGALAELEDAFKADDLARLVERFSTGRLAARDMITIIGVAMRAGGNPVTDDEVAAMTMEGGATGFARVVAELLTATFGEAGS